MIRRALTGLRTRELGLRNGEPAEAPETVSRKPSPAPKSGSRRMIVTLSVSLGLHAAAVIAVLLLLHPRVPVVPDVEKPTEVELVMEEHKGDRHPTTTPSPSPPASPTQKRAERQADQSVANATGPPDTPVQEPTQAEEASPTQTSADTLASATIRSTATPAQDKQRDPEPTPPTAQPAPAPVISLQGTDSPSDARAFGDRVIPARPDAVFHNRPPEYPVEAARTGQQGTVVVLIHVSPAGTAVGVDLVRSSGYVLLDSAAQDAVLRWRFLPAVKDGQPVASDMTMGFEFDNLQ